MVTYDFNDNFEFYWSGTFGVWELFTKADPENPKSMRALAEHLLQDVPNDQEPPTAGALALLLAANAHAYAREFYAAYNQDGSPSLSWEELECIRQGWLL